MTKEQTMSTEIQKKSKLAGLLSLLLVIALGITLAKLLWLAITPAQKIQLQTTQLSNASNVIATKKNYGSIIAKQHLFGVVKKEKAPTKQAEPVKQAAPRKRLNLKLHGVVAYKSNKAGYALISTSGGAQKVYGKGDELEENVTIKNIFPEKVIISNNGEDEELVLPRKEISKRQTTSNPPANLPSGDMPPPLPNDNMGGAGSTPDIGAFREEVMANPRKLMDIATPSPAIVDGQFIGFRVHPGPRRKMFRELGFRPNDIITEVNGIVLDNASKGAQVLAELAQAGQVSATVKRGNEEIFIELSF
jgi:general secretion pathway protein C